MVTLAAAAVKEMLLRDLLEPVRVAVAMVLPATVTLMLPVALLPVVTFRPEVSMV